MTDGTAVQALGRLADLMEATAVDLSDLAARARRRAAAVEDGQSWRDAVTDEDRPLIVERLTDILEALAGHGAAFRRAEARALHAEGLSHERIAELFGVTRQRVGALLAGDRSTSSRRRHQA